MSQSLLWRASVKQTVHDSLLPLQAIAEMAVLKVQSDKEQTMCEAEWKHLTQLLDADRQQRVSARCHSYCMLALQMQRKGIYVKIYKAAGYRPNVAHVCLPRHFCLAAHHHSLQGSSIVELV